jgi:hypothetical protein
MSEPRGSDVDAAGHERAARKRGESNGGGAGICTRVRKYIPAGLYDAYPPLWCRAWREETEKPSGTNPEKISPLPVETAVSSQPA